VSTQEIIQVLHTSGMQDSASCLNLHTGWYNEEFSTVGWDYLTETLWVPNAPSGRIIPSFISYAMDARESSDSSVRCFALKFGPPFMGLQNVRMWVDPFSAPEGWVFEVSVNADWDQALQRFRPIEEFFADGAANLMPGFDTRLEPGQMTISPAVSGDGGTYTTNWVSVKATVNQLATPGPPFGMTGDLANPMVWNFAWTEC